MSTSKLDQAVKGVPPPNAKVPTPPRLGATSSHGQSTPDSPSDPLSTLPSSPPQIYLNLLILEASLRSQYLTLRARRRQHTFFLLLLIAWNAFFFYALFMRPREDGRGVGGSVYWVVETAEKVGLMGGIVTGILVWGTGQWERGIRWPRRWVGVANRGLRGINAKLVILKGPWWRELLSLLAFLFPYTSFFPTTGSSYHYVDDLAETGRITKRDGQGRQNHRHGIEDEYLVPIEEDLSPGGDYIKLLLLPKPFSPDFRENWELYRTEYWDKENERRAVLRQKLRQRQKQLARQERGWLWWTSLRGWRSPDVERSVQTQYRSQGERDGKHRHKDRPGSGSHSRTSSRSSTPTAGLDEKPSTERLRRGNSAGNTIPSDRRKKVKSTSSGTSSRPSKVLPADARSFGAGSDPSLSLSRGSSFQGASSGNESDQSVASYSGETERARRRSSLSAKTRPRTLISYASAAESMRKGVISDG
ncbi:MAG: hypothetical protein M1833_001902 [Piccolia ochrophora]|nr:MAG: hypothetical protein M1833_001902 [Piccolia ochrophora]